MTLRSVSSLPGGSPSQDYTVKDLYVTGMAQFGTSPTFIDISSSGSQNFIRFNGTGPHVVYTGGFGSAISFEGSELSLNVSSGGLVTIGAGGLRINQTPTAEVVVPTHTVVINLNGTNYKIPLVAA